MEIGTIDNSQITSSTKSSSHAPPRNARLNYVNDKNYGGWKPDESDTASWIQVDLLQNTKITGVATQGYRQAHRTYYTITFKVSTSKDGKNYIYYTEFNSIKVS